jgi:hypothetical protein
LSPPRLLIWRQCAGPNAGVKHDEKIHETIFKSSSTYGAAMSIQAVAWALAQQSVSGPAKLVLFSLANHTDHTGVCWPSFKVIGTEASCCRRTVIAMLQELETVGLIQKEPRFAEGGRQTSNWYRLLMSGNRLEGAPNAPQGGGEGARHAPSRVHLHAPPNEPSKEPLRGAHARCVEASASGRGVWMHSDSPGYRAWARHHGKGWSLRDSKGGWTFPADRPI